MCPPVIAALPAIGTWIAGNAGAIMAGASVVSSGVGIYAKNESAKAQSEQIQRHADNEREEIGEAAEEEIGQRIRESRERRARSRVSAGESGALGASFAASINQSLADSNMDAALISKKAAFSTRGVDDRAETALGQVRSVSGLEAGLQLATAGASGYKSGLGIEALARAKPKKTKTTTTTKPSGSSHR